MVDLSAMFFAMPTHAVPFPGGRVGRGVGARLAVLGGIGGFTGGHTHQRMDRPRPPSRALGGVCRCGLGREHCARWPLKRRDVGLRLPRHGRGRRRDQRFVPTDHLESDHPRRAMRSTRWHRVAELFHRPSARSVACRMVAAATSVRTSIVSEWNLLRCCHSAARSRAPRTVAIRRAGPIHTQLERARRAAAPSSDVPHAASEAP